MARHSETSGRKDWGGTPVFVATVQDKHVRTGSLLPVSQGHSGFQEIMAPVVEIFGQKNSQVILALSIQVENCPFS